jgi:uncharacterized protein YndB with AHSA1/START domain
MRPLAFTYSGTVAAPMGDVFALLADPTRLPEWLPGCRAVVPGAGGKGARHRLSVDRGGRRTEIVIEIIEYDPPTAYGWVEILHRRGAKTFFKLGFQGGSTAITMKQVWVPGSWRTWLLGQFYRRRNAHRTFDRLLQNVRKLLTK